MAMAAVTEKIGLAGTVNSTFNEPVDVARKLATLDHLSGGRAAWNVVTSWDEFTGENFRRGGYLPKEKRYLRAQEMLSTAQTLWDAWESDEVVADAAAGQFVRQGDAGRFEVHSDQFDIAGRFAVPRSPQGRPVIIQAGDSEDGREFAAASADAIFTRHAELEAGMEFYADVKARLAKHGRRHEDLKILPAATFVLGDTESDAAENARQVQYQQVGPATAIAFAEQVWNRDLSDVDPDGPVPSLDPKTEDDVDSGAHISKGRASVRMYRDPVATANEWRELGERENLSLREVVIRKNGRHTFVGTPQRVADTIDEFVQRDASDGFVLVPHITPGGLDPFVDKVVPLLQERGSFRTDYEGTTLRENLGLAPLRSPATL
jgi:FMN-dependent oxidoreductase (nitrilotriacetate monooxygenase family)